MLTKVKGLTLLKIRYFRGKYPSVIGKILLPTIIDGIEKENYPRIFGIGKILRANIDDISLTNLPRDISHGNSSVVYRGIIPRQSLGDLSRDHRGIIPP